MSLYILLMKLTPEGREKMLDDPDSVLNAANSIRVPDIQTLGLYAVLGDHDFVSILDAPDNKAVARFSIELGVKAGVHITTLPAIPIARLDEAGSFDVPNTDTEVALPIPDDVGIRDDSD